MKNRALLLGLVLSFLCLFGIKGCEDPDFDGIPNDEDNCPSVANPQQENSDGDAAGDVCDLCPNDPEKVDDVDTDGDQILDCVDNCPKHVNSEQVDCDEDGLGDACDRNRDIDGDGKCDNDRDRDSVPDNNDNCPNNPNENQNDCDQDGFGDACDPEGDQDTDGDGDCDMEISCDHIVPTDFSTIQSAIFPSEVHAV